MHFFCFPKRPPPSPAPISLIKRGQQVFMWGPLPAGVPHGSVRRDSSELERCFFSSGHNWLSRLFIPPLEKPDNALSRPPTYTETCASIARRAIFWWKGTEKRKCRASSPLRAYWRSKLFRARPTFSAAKQLLPMEVTSSACGGSDHLKKKTQLIYVFYFLKIRSNRCEGWPARKNPKPPPPPEKTEKKNIFIFYAGAHAGSPLWRANSDIRAVVCTAWVMWHQSDLQNSRGGAINHSGSGINHCAEDIFCHRCPLTITLGEEKKKKLAPSLPACVPPSLPPSHHNTSLHQQPSDHRWVSRGRKTGGSCPFFFPRQLVPNAG